MAAWDVAWAERLVANFDFRDRGLPLVANPWDFRYTTAVDRQVVFPRLLYTLYTTIYTVLFSFR